MSGTDGYKIQYGTRSNMKGSRTATVTAATVTTWTKAGLPSGKTYYVRVRPYKAINGTTYYGAYSKTQSIKIK